MRTFLYIICQSASLLLSVTMLAMVLRILLPLFMGGEDEDSKLLMMLAFITEPVVAPVRGILYALGIGENSPVDVGFYAAYILLMMISIALPVISL